MLLKDYNDNICCIYKSIQKQECVYGWHYSQYVSCNSMKQNQSKIKIYIYSYKYKTT